MPAPAAQFSPALPWAAGTRGTIVLKEPVTGAELAQGALEIYDDNGHILEPQLNDESVDYYLDNQQVGYFRIGEDEQKNILVTQGFQVAINRIDRVSIADAYKVLKINGDDVENDGEEGYIVLYNTNLGNVGLLSQDGTNAVKCVYDSNISKVRVFNNVDSVEVGPTTKLDKIAAPTTGPLANLPLVKCSLAVNGAELELHVPNSKESFDQPFYNEDGDLIQLPSIFSLYLPTQY